MKFVLFMSVALACLSQLEAYKILVVYPFPAGSHNILGNGVVRHLLKAGHEVTYITPFPLKNNDPNLKQIDVSAVINTFRVDIVNIVALMNRRGELNNDVFTPIFEVVADVVKTENVQKFLNDPTQQFDVIVNEWLFNDLFSGFQAVFNCPYVWTFPYEPYVHMFTMIDEAPNPAYIPNMLSSNTPPFTFAQRMEELYYQIKNMLVRTYYQIPLERKVYEEAFGPVLQKRGKPLPPYDELRLNSSMVLGCSHVSIGVPMRFPENYKSIGGYHIEENVIPLPEDLQKLMDNAKHGVILFSMGSNLKSKDLPEEIKKGLVKMFGEFKEMIVWKFEEDIKDLPKNVHIMQWVPQQSILAHPNCKLFITHGGLLSTTEAAHFGVPTIGIPIFNDQFNNVDRAVHIGIMKRVDMSFSLVADLREAIKEVTSDPEYKIRAQEISLINHDRPVSAGRELVHWVEHVVRTRGALHLRSPALHVPWYQKMYLDLAAILVVLLIFVKRIVMLLVNICSSGKKNNAQKKKN